MKELQGLCSDKNTGVIFATNIKCLLNKTLYTSLIYNEIGNETKQKVCYYYSTSPFCELSKQRFLLPFDLAKKFAIVIASRH